MSKMQERLGDLVEIETASSMGRTAEEKLWMTTRAVIFWAVSRSWAVRVSALLQGSAVLLGWAL